MNTKGYCTEALGYKCVQAFKLQISTFYFPPFEKADCTIFALSVGVCINFPSPNVFLNFLFGFSSSLERNNNKCK